MKRDSSHCGSGDPLAPFGNALKSFFVFKLFLVLAFLISFVTLAVTIINSVQQNSNNNNNNNNNQNSNMQMNMNMNARALKILRVSPLHLKFLCRAQCFSKKLMFLAIFVAKLGLFEVAHSSIKVLRRS